MILRLVYGKREETSESIHFDTSSLHWYPMHSIVESVQKDALGTLEADSFEDDTRCF